MNVKALSAMDALMNFVFFEFLGERNRETVKLEDSRNQENSSPIDIYIYNRISKPYHDKSQPESLTARCHLETPTAN